MRDAPASAPRVLIYSHDTFGLGHLRRSRAIAHAIVAAERGARVVIVSGSPFVDRFGFADRVSAVRLPVVTKRVDGIYAPFEPGSALDDRIAERAAIVAATAEAFRPDLTIIDKEPTGLHGEFLPTLERLSVQGGKCVLGLRDILDDGERLAPEWARKGAVEAIERYYDEIWVYGVPRIHEPLRALPLGPATRLVYLGYLRREVPDWPPGRSEPALAGAPFLLVTPGGGGDGAGLIDWVISAYETDPGLPLPAIVAFGPFLDADTRTAFLARIDRQPGRLSAITFDSEIEHLMSRAAGIVAMGGYNTFCEILSFDRRALLVPRTEPRREQEIRAVAAEALGLARVLHAEPHAGPGRGAARMAAALRGLPDQPVPSRFVEPGLLDGLGGVVERLRALLADPAAGPSPGPPFVESRAEPCLGCAHP
ncbi:putative glycosyltransferase [Methylobacterium sp. BE186]|uniref:glycosyltransferase family protein n=1 Tax=Methylobacterium sp. BE186 TaxID=2817715 RepID=UPI00285D1EA3|nr:hypothetical protein [Methylobacterium sp. BE186]MDR7039603.1 putative glycosyltransferase [Methylobacterium sp. BE186]